MNNIMYLIDLNGNRTIPVENEACLGREHLQNCEDKRISRKHATFTVESEKIKITAIHTNPIFYRTKADATVKTLLKNDIVELEESDEIGFLPDNFWFRISAIKTENPSGNQADDSETQELDLNENITEPTTEATPLPTLRIKNAAEINQLSAISSTEEAESSQKSKRPNWMLEQNYEVGTSSPKRQKPNTHTEEADEVESSMISVRDMPDDAEPSHLNDLSNETSTISVRYVTDDEKQAVSNDPTNSPLNNVEVPTLEEANEANDSKEDIKVDVPSMNSDSPDGNDAGSSSSIANIPQVPKVTIKKEVKVEPADSSSLRDSCQFGIKCYRRNPAHLREFAHPTDSDYRRPNFPPAPPSSPDCPYGNACYRRNPVHFQQFKHPLSTNPRRNRQKLKKKNVNSGDSQLSGNTVLSTKRDRKKLILNLNYGLSDDDESDPFDDSDDDVEYEPSDDSDDDLPDTEDTPNDD